MDQKQLKEQIIAYLDECRAQDAERDAMTGWAIHAALGGAVTPAEVTRALQELSDGGQLVAENITPFCDLPTIAFSRRNTQ